jgi:predicted PurR-regulated permease PerM
LSWRSLLKILHRKPEPVRREGIERRPPSNEAVASTRNQVIFGLVALVVVAVVIYLIRDVMGAFVLAGLLAVVIDPWVRRLVAIGIPRVLAIPITLLVLLLVLAGLVTLVVPLFTEEIPRLESQAPGIAATAQAQLSRLHGRPLTILGQRIDLTDMTRSLLQNLGVFLLGQFGTAIGLGIAALGTLAQMLLMLLITFLISLDAGRIARFLRSLAPTAHRHQVDAIMIDVYRMLHAYIRGQLLIAALIGVVSGLAVWAIGVKYPLALGLLAGVTALVPYLGPFLGAIPAVVVALSAGWQQAIAVVIAYLVISNVILNLVYPKVMGDAVQLAPLAVIIAFIAGFSLAGILGMVVAVPVAATFRIIYDHLQPELFGPSEPPPLLPPKPD